MTAPPYWLATSRFNSYSCIEWNVTVYPLTANNRLVALTCSDSLADIRSNGPGKQPMTYKGDR